jgi:hypothetical protein
VENDYLQSKILSDLSALNLIKFKNNRITLTEDGISAKQDVGIVLDNALKTQKISIAYSKFCENVNVKPKEFKVLIAEILSNSNHEVYINSTSRKLYEWAKLIYAHKNANQSSDEK